MRLREWKILSLELKSNPLPSPPPCSVAHGKPAAATRVDLVSWRNLRQTTWWLEARPPFLLVARLKDLDEGQIEQVACALERQRTAPVVLHPKTAKWR
jgi:hypothetical protein